MLDTTNVVSSPRALNTKKYWQASQAWRGINYFEGKTVSDIIHQLKDVEEVSIATMIPNRLALWEQASRLLSLVINGKRKFKYLPLSERRNNKNVVKLPTMAATPPARVITPGDVKTGITGRKATMVILDDPFVSANVDEPMKRKN